MQLRLRKRRDKVLEKIACSTEGGRLPWPKQLRPRIMTRHEATTTKSARSVAVPSTQTGLVACVVHRFDAQVLCSRSHFVRRDLLPIRQRM